MASDNILMRMPTVHDGLKVHELIAVSPPLDLNSVYSYYLLCGHFTDTCVVAEHEGNIVGFLSAYLIPGKHDTLFVWQVVVGKNYRGHRIATRMLESLLARYEGESVKFVEATVNPGNTASRRLFESLSQLRGTTVEESTFLEAAAFGISSDHESEILLRIPLHAA
jgi:L-2,4-diaminobutyric acid acetyltransferase